MKATLRYDLSDTDQVKEHLRAVKSLDLAIAIWDMKQAFRTKLKGDLSEHDYELYEGIQNKFFEILEENNINLDELIS